MNRLLSYFCTTIMTSLSGKIIIGLIKNRHLFKGKLRPIPVDETFDVLQFRESIESGAKRMKLPKEIREEHVDLDGIHGIWLHPKNPAPGKALLYIHGGGFISGSAASHKAHVAKFAQGSQTSALVFDYRLAPEHPFPAAIEDCIHAYQWLLNHGYTAHDIIVGGESAGATLTLSLLLALKQNKINLPKAAFSISPVTDLSCQAQSFFYNAPKDIAPPNSWNIWTSMYVGESSTKNPLLSPLFGDYRGLPPIYFCIGTHEIHYDDCLAVEKKAKEAGVKTELREWQNMVHAFPLLSPFFPEAREAMKEICRFIQNQCIE